MPRPPRSVLRPVLPLALVAVLGCSAPGPSPSASGSSAPGTADPRPGDGADAPIAFVGVDVLPMDSERVLHDHTVVVEGQRIVAVGPRDEVDVPSGARVVDGRGRFLMPGLAEMHAHVPGPSVERQWLEDLLFLYVANGVTTIRGMLGAPNQLEMSEQTATGELLGPTIYVAAPSLNGNSAPDPATAERLVREHAAAGYHLLKIHPGLSRATWDRIVATADEVGLTLAGHVPADVGIRHALESGISTVDHLDGYLEGSLAPAMRERLQGGAGVPLGEVIDAIDPERTDALVRLTAQTGAWNVPTLYLWENLFRPVDADSVLRLPEMRYVPRSMREGWARQKAGQPVHDADDAQRLVDFRNDLLVRLNDAGARILMGTDTPQMFNVPGFALLREIRIMEEAGLDRYTILASGTRNVGRYVAEDLGLDGRFGTVEVGGRADLVLLRSNPLEGLGTLEEPAGVMVRGRWVPEGEIHAGLARIEARYGG